jgi:very-short-patch-repair endonuclease
MWWPGLGVIGEADGVMKYGSADDLIAEKAREDRLRALGLMVVRWTWDEIRANPAQVAERIRRAARRAA